MVQCTEFPLFFLNPCFWTCVFISTNFDGLMVWCISRSISCLIFLGGRKCVGVDVKHELKVFGGFFFTRRGEAVFIHFRSLKVFESYSFLRAGG